MKIRVLPLAAFLFATLASGCGNKPEVTFENPVVKEDCPDPTILDNRERDGVSLLEGRKSEQQVLNKSADGTCIGSGHNAEIVTDDKGQDWMMFHTYWKGDGYAFRDAALGRVFWDEEGWPYFQDSACQSVSPAPAFK